MRILISTRKRKTVSEARLAVQCKELLEAKHPDHAILLDNEVAWTSLDDPEEKFEASVKRVVPTFDAVVLIEELTSQGHRVIGRGQHKVAEVARTQERKLYVFRGGRFLPVKDLRVADPTRWASGFAACLV